MALTIAVVARADMYKGYEQPPFAVNKIDGDIELRRYAPHIVAEVQVDGSREQAIRRGFRVLADFIFGGNESGESVAMTVPVSQLPGDGVWTVRFMMPAAYRIEDLPRPSSDSIRFVETGPEEHLVIRFSGLATTRALATKTQTLMQYAADQGLKVAGPARYHFYDDPFTLPWNRRNEVSIPLS
ncbi:heme-binding protein [Thalassococcus sp. S3]|uniref:SOUL family heme-binding protein n=1 Tax=Thalassococcus sp. S3 TaxID=2017482 RepID=UPI0020C3136C|nr:heme-binding protein [Thalassococcus sp. S3]